MMVYTSSSIASLNGQGARQQEKIITQEARSAQSDRSPEGMIIRQAVGEIVEQIRECVFNYMPPSTFREYYLWGLDSHNVYHDAWLQLTGVKQTVQFAARVMGAQFEPKLFLQLARFVAPMNHYLTFEVISDNLALGLAEYLPHDSTFFLRAHLMHDFNVAVCNGLKGDGRDAHEVLSVNESLARRISTFRQSLSPLKHGALADAYLNHTRYVPMDDIEYSLYPLLLANFEAATHLARHSESLVTGPIIRRGLYRRYHSADRLLIDPNLSMGQVVNVSTYAILIMPVVAYYLEGVASTIGLRDKLPSIVQDGSLFKALYHAALLIRLLNDLGTGVVKQESDDRMMMLQDLYSHSRDMRSDTLTGFLRDVSDQYGARLTRIAKDVKYGEFNIALYNLRNGAPFDYSFGVFGERLEYFSLLYRQKYARMQQHLDIMAQRLGDDTLSNLIERSVIFHERLYDNVYTQERGEYAI
ncbi:MAG: hypothetical protein IH587_13895 [Anaerolineae bacterium]|nr:hypothetical protein [Anaerolineae bacterium]